MSLCVKKLLNQFKKENKGSFTIEASLVFPTIFMSTIILIFLSLVVYEKVVVYQRAHLIAERVSFTWDNSEKDFNTGYFEPNTYTSMDGMDGLYWRTTSIGQNFIERIFGSLQEETVRGSKISRATNESQGLITGSNISIEVDEGFGFNQKVHVTVEQSLHLPEFVDFLTGGTVEGRATAAIKDPVELVRTTDFIFHYGEEIMNYISD